MMSKLMIYTQKRKIIISIEGKEYKIKKDKYNRNSYD